MGTVVNCPSNAAGFYLDGIRAAGSAEQWISDCQILLESLVYKNLSD